MKSDYVPVARDVNAVVKSFVMSIAMAVVIWWRALAESVASRKVSLREQNHSIALDNQFEAFYPQFDSNP